MNAVKANHKAFLDQAINRPQKVLPYKQDKVKVEISNHTLVADKSTCIKFIQSLVSIIQNDFDHHNSIRGLQVWVTYLQSDRVLRQSFKPNNKMLNSLNLDHFISEVYSDDNSPQTGKEVLFTSADAQTVFNFCSYIINNYSSEFMLTPSSFFHDVENQSFLDEYERKYWLGNRKNKMNSKRIQEMIPKQDVFLQPLNIRAAKRNQEKSFD